MQFRVRGAVWISVLCASLPGLAAEPSPVPACHGCECASTRPELAVVGALPSRDWKERFGAPALIRAQGGYAGSQRWQFESFSLHLLQPSPTAEMRVDRTTRALLIADPQPGLKENPARPPPWTPSTGSVSVTGWVDSKFSDVLVRGVVNAAGTDTAESRQGLLARWDRHHNYYWFYIDFASGQAAIGKQQPGTATAIALPGSEVAIPGFKKTMAYQLEFRLEGSKLKGRVLDKKGQVLAQTPEIEDAQPHVCGISGVNAELSLNAPFAPLKASFADLSARALPGGK